MDNENLIFNSDKIIKLKNLDVNLISINNHKLYYNNNNNICIQTPIFKTYNLINYNNNLYLQINLNEFKISNVKFLNFIDTIEIILKNNNINFKTQILNNLNFNSVKIKLNKNCKLYDKINNEISILNGKPIILLLSFEINENYYSIIANEILEL